MPLSQHRHADPNAGGDNKNPKPDDSRGPDSNRSQIEVFEQEGAGIAAKE